MVSTNSTPPAPHPMHVPQGHMVQQVLDENGTLQHVILALDPMAMPPVPQQPQQMTVSTTVGGATTPPSSTGSAQSSTVVSNGTTSPAQQFVPMPIYVSVHSIHFPLSSSQASEGGSL